jgi:hypothetical protein
MTLGPTIQRVSCSLRRRRTDTLLHADRHGRLRPILLDRAYVLVAASTARRILRLRISVNPASPAEITRSDCRLSATTRMRGIWHDWWRIGMAIVLLRLVTERAARQPLDERASDLNAEGYKRVSEVAFRPRNGARRLRLCVWPRGERRGTSPRR